MPCAIDVTRWKHRRALRLSNGSIELTTVQGGGHIVDFRLCGSSVNLLWEAPWPTIDPQNFSPALHSHLFGSGPAGKLLSGYSGHAVALGYFGMPSPIEAEQGLGLHGEAANLEWRIISRAADELCASVVLEVSLPVYQLRLRRKISFTAESSVVRVEESVLNRSPQDQQIQWVEHAAFGKPFFANREASLSLSAGRAVTWPLGYEGHELLPASDEFEWPHARTITAEPVDLSSPFTRPGTGFVASLLIPSDRHYAYVAVHNRLLATAAGYVFEAKRFPWIALWEENCARSYPPWRGVTRVRGVEFGTSPMPLGLEQARQTHALFDTPVLASIPAHASLETHYLLFASKVPQSWTRIEDVQYLSSTLMIQAEGGEQITLGTPR